MNETNESPAIKTVTLTSPDDSEDLDEIREWARQNAAAALAWALNAPGGPKRDAVAEIVCAQLAQSDPAQAVALAESFASGCSPVLENVVQQWADQDESAAYAFAANKPPGEPRDRLLSRVAFARSQKDPAAAAKLVAEEISPGEIQNEAAISVLHQWALRDTDTAMVWAQLFPAGDLRDRAMKEVENVATALAGQKPYSLDN